MQTTFCYGTTRVGNLHAHTTLEDRTGKVHVDSVEVEGRPAVPSPRFWTSMFMRFGFAESVFRYFAHHEVFARIAARCPDDTIRYCVEVDPQGRRTLLAVSSPNRPVVRPAEILEIVGRYGNRPVEYSRGVIRSFHTPRSGDQTTRIGPDEFQRRFQLETPVDGHGNPRLYLAVMRLVCTNGMVARAATFRSEIRVGREVIHSLVRALESFDHGEGYAALHQRFESAQQSWASLHECHKLYRTIVRLQYHNDVPEAAIGDFNRLSGNLNELYGLANLDALSAKRQRILPAKCRVYDLLNFASELATHHATPWGSQALHDHIGSLVSDEYDLEGTANKVGDFQDFFVADGNGLPPASLN